MEHNGRIGTRANPSREPFSDVSNAASSSAPRLPNSKRKRPSKSQSRQLRPDPPQNEFLSRPETAAASMSREVASCSTAGPSDLDSVSGDCNFVDMSERATVSRRRNTTRTEHTANATSRAALSCPPRRRKTEQNKGKKSKKGVDGVTLRVVSSAPCKRWKKPENFALPENFVREQREYFAKLDEEELIVEEADSE